MTRSIKTLLGLFASLVLAGCAGTPAVKPDRPAVSATKPAPGKPAAGTSTTPVKPVVAKDPATQFEDSLAALKAKNFPEARAGFELLAKEHPEFAGPLTNLGILDAKADADVAAIATFNRAIAANPRNAIAYNWLGILYREAKNYPRAEQSYLQSLTINPDNAAVVLNLAILYDVYLKRPVDALARYRDYQRMTGTRELKVTAWIKALEAAQPAPTPPAPAVNTKS
ncbi:MAG: tetratricopeptide repeat protein [Pseudomonadota bacterium]